MHDLNITQLKHHAAIGGVALNWTHLENTLQSLLWRLADIDVRTGRCITQHIQTRSLCDVILTIARESPAYSHLAAELEGLMKQCDQLRMKRNDTVHALWALFVGPPGEVPKVINAGAGEVTGIVVKARGRLSLKINHTTVSQIDDISEEIIALNKRFAEFAAKNLPNSKTGETSPAET